MKYDMSIMNSKQKMKNASEHNSIYNLDLYICIEQINMEIMFEK